MPNREFVYPEIDYTNHPYYADIIPTLTAEDREKSLFKFYGIFEAIVAQQAAHQRYILANPAAREVGAPSTDLAALNANGILALRLDQSDLDRTFGLVRETADQLSEKRAATKPERLGVEAASQLVCRVGDGSDTYAFFSGLLTKHGVFEMCQAHKGLPYRLKFVMLQHNTGDDRGLSSICSFEDGRQSKAFYTHIDSQVDPMKVIVYLTPNVSSTRGAFRYFPGSFSKHSALSLAIRKANDKCGWQGVAKPGQRRAFVALPADMRKKATFGDDILDDEIASAILEHEHAYESSEGNMLLFNPDGAHRGAIFSEPGERKILQFQLIPDLPVAIDD